MNKKFTAFDSIHCKGEWKQAVYNEIGKKKKSYHVLRYACLIMGLLVFCSGIVVASSDTVQEWLRSIFSNEKQSAIVKEFPVHNIDDDVCFISQDSYVKEKCSKMNSKKEFTVYQLENDETTILKKQIVHTEALLENQKIPIKFSYLSYENKIFPFGYEKEDGTMLSDIVEIQPLSYTSNGVVIVVEHEQVMNAYILNLSTMDMKPIVEDSTNNAKGEIRDYAYEVQVSMDGSFVLYRNGFVDGEWNQNGRLEHRWVLWNTKKNTREELAFLPSEFRLKDVSFIDDSRLSYYKTNKEDVAYPVVYDCITSETTEYKEYDYRDNQYASGMIVKEYESCIDVLDLRTNIKETIKIDLNEEFDEHIMVYPNFYIAVENGTLTRIYIVKQKRWVNFNQAKIRENFEFAYPINDHSIVINQRYVLNFQEK